MTDFTIGTGSGQLWLRVSGPGMGGRNVDLSRLAEAAADDAGWAALCALMAMDWSLHDRGVAEPSP